MTYTFSVGARSQLDALLQVNDYLAAYILLSDILKAADPVTSSRPIDDVAVHQTQLFLEGAALANESVALFSDGIRDYTRAPGVFRYGGFFSNEELQNASALAVPGISGR